MFRRTLAALTLSFALCGAISAQSHSVHELAPGVFVWQGDRDNREPANCTWVIFKDYVLVIDANFPWGAREIIQKIKSTSDKPIRFVAATHYHADHTFGSSVFMDAGATMICTEACGEEVRAKNPSGWANWNNPQHSLEGARFEPVTVTFSDKMIFDDGVQRVELIKLGPAHSRGDSVAWLPKQRILATGDLCVTWAFGNNVGDASADYDNWLHALETMISWAPATVIPGHGAPGSIEALQTQRGYMSEMLGRVREGKKAGKSADDLVHSIDLSRYGTIAHDADANATSIRAMYRHLQN